MEMWRKNICIYLGSFAGDIPERFFDRGPQATARSDAIQRTRRSVLFIREIIYVINDVTIVMADVIWAAGQAVHFYQLFVLRLGQVEIIFNIGRFFFA